RNRQGGGNNRNRNRNRNRSRRRREPKPTPWQKFLSTITFGLLGKPKRKKSQRKPKQAPRTSSRSTPRQQPADKKPAPAKRRNRTEVTSGRLYVGNLDYGTTESDLEELFRGIGNVLSAEVVTNSRTQQSKGFAFVEMVSIEAAKRAVEILDDQEFMGRKLIVSGARSEGPREREDEQEGSTAGKPVQEDSFPAETETEEQTEIPEVAEIENAELEPSVPTEESNDVASDSDISPSHELKDEADSGEVGADPSDAGLAPAGQEKPL
ncbi:MAG: RNA-binding protein, partial [Verrucomicrobiota bacterium]